MPLRVHADGDGARVELDAAPPVRFVAVDDADLRGVRLGFDAGDHLVELAVHSRGLLPADLEDGAETRCTHDPVGGMAYLYLTSMKPGSSVRNVVIDDHPGSDVIVDVDKQGRITGIEFYGDDALPPALRRN